jgi:hypothetical protein
MPNPVMFRDHLVDGVLHTIRQNAAATTPRFDGCCGC